MQPRAARYRVDFRVVWDDGESYFTSAVTDISESGIFIETTMPVPPGREVTIMPLVDGLTIFELKGRVAREVHEDLDNNSDGAIGMGVKFEDINPGKLSELRTMLEKHKR